MAPKHIKMQYLKQILANEITCESENQKPFAMWANLKVAPIFSKSKISQKYLKEISPLFKELISAARYI